MHRVVGLIAGADVDVVARSRPALVSTGVTDLARFGAVHQRGRKSSLERKLSVARRRGRCPVVRMSVFSNMCYEFSEVRRGVEIIAEADVVNLEFMTRPRRRLLISLSETRL